MPNYDEIEQAVDMTDSLRTIDDVEDVSMEVQVLKLLKDLKKEISYGSFPYWRFSLGPISLYIGYNTSKGIIYISMANMSIKSSTMEDKFQETQFKNKNNQDYSDEESDEDNPKSELQLTIEKQLSQKLWQLCNWNVTGFNFDFGGQRTIRAPDVVFKQFAIWMCYRIGPFKGNYSPIKVTNVMFKSESEFKAIDDKFKKELKNS
ncbi:hypothetical protein RhiirA5_416030 [Rhizophagus irregularis]|uniref:Uncharacterized protein n=2 Tax=Rhizophagus irregularis TaxID=588596 RepID=A0A2I1EA01_9GLOM|nr:hypothetical protein GLOIN_2v1774527 [Rhizophagus irregularis DAOM 181602=DAOM 197198]PKC09140.1 hypothetical protein RhiirA5_416030 [Rhizophagus irregularis]PKC64148.1 hypothetical protein RhiirA1_462804 [Rhizophagus irregularis]PKY18960.1 hypothetical protein RhiirB3_523165 [Rhizophagus irregularis]POG71660.1 hypothetical protein GLOIN_2v1774527 [Rhizophagus irregularis DAOM 181602=DAOM 197198]CAG8668560.1 11081_t:CDS:2 [Rhizophagus irregularis]|eukprot:XP_025178526.1 hypothetical protein GLOIN_2v1774527 [Rhizophagus irregularis DAOM 181602=DAOM 197198]